MGQKAKFIFRELELGKVTVYVPAMVLAEILYLSQKNRIGISVGDISDYMKKFPKCKEYPMDAKVIQSASEVTDIPELHDRLITGTARSLKLDLITNDSTIKASKFVNTVW